MVFYKKSSSPPSLSAGFLEKNRDSFSADLHALVHSSKMHLLLRIFDEADYVDGTGR